MAGKGAYNPNKQLATVASAINNSVKKTKPPMRGDKRTMASSNKHHGAGSTGSSRSDVEYEDTQFT